MAGVCNQKLVYSTNCTLINIGIINAVINISVVKFYIMICRVSLCVQIYIQI